MSVRWGDWRPLGPQTQSRMSRHDIICLHTMVGTLVGTDSYFRQSGYGGTESHWGVGGDGRVFQWQDTDYVAEANLNGNHHVLSVETADIGPEFPGGTRPTALRCRRGPRRRWTPWRRSSLGAASSTTSPAR